MDGNRERMRDIFDQARRLPQPERAAFLNGLAAVHRPMRSQIEDMLAALDEAGTFLSEPTRGAAVDATATLAAPIREGPGTRIGPYKLLQQIGEGGFGSVFMAEQEKPVSRKVALKIIKLGMDTKAVIARFEAERQALAMMDHPNIARVLDAGATDAGRPFFVMELCKGDPIHEYCDRNHLSIPERLALFEQVCVAVQHAHSKGIIHRDIKPSNVLVSTQDGRPHAKVIDFGIAKATASKLTEKTLFTEHRALIGTPEYMSPEQAEGSLDIDTRTDVYSLGVLLYELLTGTTPFSSKELRSAAFAEIQRIIREIEPPKPSTRISHNTDTLASVAAHRHTEPKRLGTLVRGELDWIVMKALEKDRQRRYETASGLAIDVERYLSGEAVLAAPPSTAYRFKKVIRRNKGPVAAGAAVLLALVIGLAGTLWKADEARREANRANNEAATARAAEGEQRRLAESEGKARTLADKKTAEVVKASETIEYNSYVGNVEMAGASMDARQFDRVRRRLDACPERLRAWEWRWLDARADSSLLVLRGHTDLVTTVAFSPDGKRIVTASADGTARVWDAATGAPFLELKGHTRMIESARISADGTRIVTASWDGTARVWDAATGATTAELKGHQVDGHTAAVLCADISPDGTRVVTGSVDRTSRVWDVATGATLLELKVHTQAVRVVAFSPDGTRIFTASLEGADLNNAHLWDAATGASIAELKGHTRGMWMAAFSGDGTRIVTPSLDKTARVWDAATGALLVELKGHAGGLRSAAFSPDGTRIATSSYDTTARVWDAASGASIVELKGHTGPLLSVAFSPDGAWIVTTSADKTARVWNAATGASLSELRGHTSDVFSAGFNPDASRIVTVSGDHTARLWDARMDAVRAELVGHTDYVNAAAFSPDGRRVLTASDDKTARVWDVVTGASLLDLKGHDGMVFSAAFSPDGTRILTTSDDKSARIWDATTGATLFALKADPSPVSDAAFSADGTRIVTASRDNTARVWDATTGSSLAELKGHTSDVVWAAFSPNSTRIVTASSDSTARVWDAASGASLAELKHPAQVRRAVFSPDGTRIITASYDGAARVWDAATGASLAELRGHDRRPDGFGMFPSIAFSPDGKRLVTGSTAPDGPARVWDTSTWKMVFELRSDAGEVYPVKFSPDGARIVGCNGTTIRVWDAATGASLAELKGHNSHVRNVSFSPDGTQIVTPSADRTARIWDSVPYRERFKRRQSQGPR